MKKLQLFFIGMLAATTLFSSAIYSAERKNKAISIDGSYMAKGRKTGHRGPEGHRGERGPAGKRQHCVYGKIKFPKIREGYEQGDEFKETTYGDGFKARTTVTVQTDNNDNNIMIFQAHIHLEMTDDKIHDVPCLTYLLESDYTNPQFFTVMTQPIMDADRDGKSVKIVFFFNNFTSLDNEFPSYGPTPTDLYLHFKACNCGKSEECD